MPKKQEEPIRLDRLEPEEKLKYEIAGELGLLDRVLAEGWKSLTAKETGKIGGMLAKRRKSTKKEEASRKYAVQPPFFA